MNYNDWINKMRLWAWQIRRVRYEAGIRIPANPYLRDQAAKGQVGYFEAYARMCKRLGVCE